MTSWKSHFDERAEQESVMQFRAPTREARGVRLVPRTARPSARSSNCLDELICGHARHFEAPPVRAGRWRPVGPSGEYSLSIQNSAAVRVAGHIDQQVAQRPGRSATAAAVHYRATPRRSSCMLDLLEGDLQLVKLVVAVLRQHAVPAGRSEEQSREQVSTSTDG